MGTLKRLTREDGRVALESISRTAADMAIKRNITPRGSARVVAIAMLEGVATNTSVQCPVVLLRGGKTEAELADELEALAAEYRQRLKKTETFMKAASSDRLTCAEKAFSEPCEAQILGADHTPISQQDRGIQND